MSGGGEGPQVFLSSIISVFEPFDTVTEGSGFSVFVNAINLIGAEGVRIRITYDHNVLRLQDADIPCERLNARVPAGDFAGCNSPDEGIIILLFTWPNSINDDHWLAEIPFDAINVANTTQIGIEVLDYDTQ